jgi:4'-phosphopantetheinyl transferase EntD
LAGLPSPSNGLFARILPSVAVVVEAEEGDWEAPLLAEEEPMVARAVDRRRREVSAGRQCARRALAQLGCAPIPLPPDSDRVPRWPPGLVGSITHTRDFCAAAAARQVDLRGIGLDAERAITRASRADIMRRVATDPEAEWLAALEEEEQALGAALLFSAKEAFYKCQFPLTREFLNFTDLDLEIEASRLGPGTGGAQLGDVRGRFRAGTAAARDLPPLRAGFALAGDLVLTAAFLLA